MSDDKLLNALINSTPNIKNKSIENIPTPTKEEIKKIKERFKELELCQYILPGKIKVNTKIMYVDKDLKKCSKCSTVTEIEYYSIIKMDKIRTIHLCIKDPVEGDKYWKINPSKYYIFKYKTIHKTKNEKLVSALYEDFFNEIEKYKKNLENEK